MMILDVDGEICLYNEVGMEVYLWLIENIKIEWKIKKNILLINKILLRIFHKRNNKKIK
jgi:hypothetical protein